MPSTGKHTTKAMEDALEDREGSLGDEENAL
jgi:hypothetical protein